MKRDRKHAPPSWAQRFIMWYCKPELAEDLIGDLNEYFERNLKSKGARRAKWIYGVDAFKFFRTYTVRKPEFPNLLISRHMLGNYVKTSGRNLMRNKLFSLINVMGLAFSMSVGLLLIAFFFDMNSYDRFNANGDQIYRITSTPTINGEKGQKFGTTSKRTGKLIKGEVAGIEEVTVLHRDFSKDVEVGDQKLQLKGYWADASIFNVFTFAMMEGNPDSALKNPYTVVLTESTAKKIFGNEPALGKEMQFEGQRYQVTGIMKDVPFFSHLKFEVLVSMASLEQENIGNRELEAWTSMWSDYVYFKVQDHADIAAIQQQLNTIASNENRADEDTTIQLGMLPLYAIVVGEDLGRNQSASGPHMSPLVLWLLGGLGLVVILSACFNYTNLTIARSMRRFKEIGLRKTIGARKFQVRMQFLVEAVLVSLVALLFSFLLFFILRPQLINLAPDLQEMVKLQLTPARIVSFVIFSVIVGIIAGFMPAIFLSKITAVNALRNIASEKVFKHLTLRRALVVVQYTFTLIFVTATAIGYVQYKNILAFDLGFNADNILNIDMQGNDPEVFLQELKEMPEVTELSRSLIVTSIGNAWGGFMKYKDSRDSTLVLTNHVDENYLNVHGYQLIAGGNFVAKPATAEAVREVIVNQKVLERFNIAPDDPEKAIGEVVTFKSFNTPLLQMTIVGVMKDFHYGRVEDYIEPAAFIPWTPKDRAVINAKIRSADLPATLAKIESTWKKVDRVHPFKAQFYDEAIQEAYSEYSIMIKIIGFLSLLTIIIASMGLFGMVAYTTETRLKEISIRKVMGASLGNLIYILGRGFLALLSLAALIALPITYLFFNKTVLTRFPYHEPVHALELFGGLLAVILVALFMIGSQALNAAKRNPSEVLKMD